MTGQVVVSDRRVFKRDDGSEWTRTEVQVMVAFRGVTTLSLRDDEGVLPEAGDLVDVLARYAGEYRGQPRFDLVGPWQVAFSGELLNPAAFARPELAAV
ncbi:MAG: hypothetical protein LBG60_13855 [Bifidobacteriaceae bacterium]|nr:hypothetical protein [Bifidobacteriaceae bacterium]